MSETPRPHQPPSEGAQLSDGGFTETELAPDIDGVELIRLCDIEE